MTPKVKAKVPLSRILTPEEIKDRERKDRELYDAAMDLKRIMEQQGLPVDENI